MENRHYTRILVISNIVQILTIGSCHGYGLEVKPQRDLMNNELCEKVGTDPFFEIDMVVGKPWRIYYTWHMELEKKCVDMTFKPATPMIIQRIYNDMSEHLETQPAWDAALLLVTLGKASHEMLLFVDQGPAGRLLAIPNVAREGHLLMQNRQPVPLLKFQIKLLQGGKYLLMLDCLIGVTSLMARVDDPPYRSELDALASSLDMGDGGAHACVQDKNNGENLVYSDDKTH